MNINNNNSIRERIMRRVYFIWFAKKIAPYILIESALFAGFVFLIGHYVFVSKVMQYAGQILANNSLNPEIWGAFAFNTFFKTRFVVQLSILGSLAMIILMFKNFILSLAQLTLAKEETKTAG
ncbi:hypothetical protein HY838_00945 [Candidatus Azambacteria bacterium]|nr:hypothetical protein [Candidatus Azambacteria bacterium]